MSLLNKTGFENLRISTPNLYLDRYYGYPMGTRKISDRFEGYSLPDGLSIPAKEVYHTNWLHPSNSGYAQMGDAFFAAYLAALS